MIEGVLIVLAVVLMVAGLALVVIPAVPVAALEWAIVMAFGVLTGFTRTPLVAVALVTLFMLLGSTAGLWLPLFGLEGQGVSCLGLLAFFVGCAVGGALIPAPILGTLIGGVVGVMLVEFAKLREFRAALRRGGAALRVILTGMALEFVFALAILATFLVSVWATG
jgi:uncharacterized protein YqgC (DUF456 family)